MACRWALWTLTFSAVLDKILSQYLESKISNTREDTSYLVKSSHRRSVLTSMASRTSSRIWIKSLLSSVKVWGSGSRPLSVRNFNKTVKMKTEKKKWGMRRQKQITFTLNYYFMERENLNNVTTVTRPIKHESQHDCTISHWTRPSPHFHPSKQKHPYTNSCNQRMHHMSPSAPHGHTINALPPHFLFVH